MGCLNSGEGFSHWFSNIHLSGPCNRSCYFCIGQWMPGQDMNNNLGDEPLLGYGEFLTECIFRGIREVNITGTNTDPLLKSNLESLCLNLRVDGFENIGIRTNGVKSISGIAPLIDKISISVTTLDARLYKETMGSGSPPNLDEISAICAGNDVDLKLNVVICPEVTSYDDILQAASRLGIKRINFREPYGQPHCGNPFSDIKSMGEIFGNPQYDIGGVICTYWDVHYTHVESVNLYADGKVSLDYPVTRGHSEEFGEVFSQDNFTQGRQRSQWVSQ